MLFSSVNENSPKKANQTFEQTKPVPINDTKDASPSFEEDLLTPQLLLSSYQAKKAGSQSSTHQPQQQKVNILELLLANSKSNPSPPHTPKTSSHERFAGLSSSPAPCNLPQPSFHFLDQELRKEDQERSTYSTPIHFNRTQQHQRVHEQSPPTNPHLEDLTSSLKMLLNIPVHS